MPQGHRKVPFSAKQKKQQLQKKRGQQAQRQGYQDDSDDNRSRSPRPSGARSRPHPDHERYKLQFQQDTREELETRRQQAQKPIVSVGELSLEIDMDSVFLPGSQLDLPKRPPWDYAMSKEKLDMREHSYFKDYLADIKQNFPASELSYFENNLETWRQLWRVLEMADIVLVILDIRFPQLLFSPALYDHVKKQLGKDIILILNKIDLAPPSLVVAWKHYFKDRFPELYIVCFTSFPGKPLQEVEGAGRKLRKKVHRGRMKMAAEGALTLLEVCEKIVKDNLDLHEWRDKIESELHEVDTEEDEPNFPISNIEHVDTSYHKHERYKDGVLTIGCVGQPNVGKSSLINALMGKKVVSVSRTPGHTKHFQTIFLTSNVKLCDCPGLVFPSKVPRPLQILTGSYPIAQLREPYTAIMYLAERLPLPRLLQLRHPDEEGNLQGLERPWSAIDICDAWAEKRGFKTAKAARNDTYRAANNILRMALEGRICLCLRPPGYADKKETWESHSDVDEILRIVQKKVDFETEAAVDSYDGDSEESGREADNSSNDGSDSLPPGAVAAVNKFSLLGHDD